MYLGRGLRGWEEEKEKDREKERERKEGEGRERESMSKNCFKNIQITYSTCTPYRTKNVIMTHVYMYLLEYSLHINNSSYSFTQFPCYPLHQWYHPLISIIMPRYHPHHPQ